MYSYACKSLVPTVAVPETSIFLCKGNVIGMHMPMCIHFYTQLYVYFCRGIFHFSLWQAARVAASRKVIHQFNKFLLNDYENIIIIFEASIYYIYIYIFITLILQQQQYFCFAQNATIYPNLIFYIGVLKVLQLPIRSILLNAIETTSQWSKLQWIYWMRI